MKGLLVLLFVCLCGWAVAQPVPDTAGWQIADATYDLIAKSGESAVYHMIVKNKLENGTEVDAYENPPYLVRLKGSRHDMGGDYATLVGDEVVDCYNSALKKAGVTLPQRTALQVFLDRQWSQYLSKQVPQDYMDELQGMKKVSRSVYNVVTRIIVIANLPSDLPEDMMPILNDERQSGEGEKVREERENEWEILREGWKGFKAAQCSMMAVWGDRTQDSQLFSGRNLDYVANMGINPWKSVIIWIPSSSSTFASPIPHASFGYLALYGSLSGMNKEGVTVHEANLEEKNETFSGFPWVIRLRYIMEGASDLQEGVDLWKATNNTVGYNHMIAHNPPPSPSPSPAAVAMETAAHYTAYFQDMDPREQNCVVNGENVGSPLPEALWRTNHPYDPKLMDDYLWWGTSAYSSSQARYMIAHDTIKSYEDTNVVMDYIQAINLTANVADKGSNSPYLCEFPYASHSGTNILSVTHQPNSDISYVAWDNGEGDNWSPACCNTYVKVDFAQWW